MTGSGKSSTSVFWVVLRPSDKGRVRIPPDFAWFFGIRRAFFYLLDTRGHVENPHVVCYQKIHGLGPYTQDGNEYFTYELTSVLKSRKAQNGVIDQTPRQFDMSINEFIRIPRVRASGPLPRGLDENTINKVAFFVDNSIVNRCPKNTLVISGVRLQP